MERLSTVSGNASLLDILDRVLDKGLVIAGDVRISLANVELLTIRIRLLVCSVDKAEQIGLNWWKYDSNLTAPMPAIPAATSAGAANHLSTRNGRRTKMPNTIPKTRRRW